MGRDEVHDRRDGSGMGFMRVIDFPGRRIFHYDISKSQVGNFKFRTRRDNVMNRTGVGQTKREGRVPLA